MRQRLGLAAALLGDPQVLVLDEPANGLDPQGIRWLRDFLRSLAREGRAVLVSSHVLADRLLAGGSVLRAHRSRRRSLMTGLVSAELFKLRTTRTFYGIVAGAVGLVLLIVIVASATATWSQGDTPLRDLVGISGFAQVFALVLGILALTSEFRHGTITPSLLVVPDRVRLTVAKLGASLASGLALGLAATGLAAAIGAAILGARGIDTGQTGSQVTKMVVGGTIATALYSALGVGVGALVRNQVGAIVGALVYLFVLENLLQIVEALRDPLAKFGFGGVGQGLTGSAEVGADHPPLGQVSAGLVLAGYCAILMIVGIAMMKRRDVTA
jgi:ABC-2 type transport system permease protein